MRQSPSSEYNEAKPEFSPFLSLPTREKWESLKHELFSADELYEVKKQPHGIDLLLQNLVEIGGQNLGDIIMTENPKEGTARPSFHLPYGKEFFAVLYPPIKRPYRWQEFALHLLPRSSLIRAGILARESDFYGTENQELMNQLGERFDYYEDGRQAAIRIKVLNPNGVTIEQGAPIVQIIVKPLPANRPDAQRVAQEQTRFLRERESEKRQPLHLGEVREFLSRAPHIASNQEENKLDVTAPLNAPGGRYALRQGVPCLFRTKEAVKLTNHEVAFTQGTRENADITIVGDSLVDAGYEGQLTYLAIPQKDMTIEAGEVISYLFKAGVPTTQEPYKGRWR